jgi:mono/diheme cytochrome c family protein
MRGVKPFLLAWPLLLAVIDSAPVMAQTATVLDGVYTTAQASRGRTAYNRYCRECHLNDLEGGALEPPLVSGLFLDAWREDYLLSLYDFISTRMPKGKNYTPGSLKPEQYLDIVTYILSRNDFPTGSNELTPAGLASILLVGLEGPQPLPPNAMVRAVGCFSGEAGTYRLLQSTMPARVRTGDETSEEEVAKSAVAPLGDSQFQLNNLEVISAADALPAYIGRKVQLKGVLNGNGESARIFVLSLADTGTKCTD